MAEFVGYTVDAKLDFTPEEVNDMVSPPPP